MSTRSTISIEGFKPIVYKHWDGYPSHMMPWLKEFNAQFTAMRGDIELWFDVHYKFAQLLRSSVLMQEKYELDPSIRTGYGVFDSFSDIGQEYSYILLKDGSVAYHEGAKNPQKSTSKLKRDYPVDK